MLMLFKKTTLIKMIFNICFILFFLSFHSVTHASQWQSHSKGGLYKVVIKPKGEKHVMGDYHSWLISLADKNGKAVNNASIYLKGGMQAHGHGLPTQPLVKKTQQAGEYVIEGLLFNMAGEWSLQFFISTPLGNDQVAFELALDF